MSGWVVAREGGEAAVETGGRALGRAAASSAQGGRHTLCKPALGPLWQHASPPPTPTSPRRNQYFWDSGSTLAGEGQYPSRPFPRALAGARGWAQQAAWRWEAALGALARCGAPGPAARSRLSCLWPTPPSPLPPTCPLPPGAVVLVVAAYLLPLLVGLGVTDDPSAWQLGYFTTLGQQVRGRRA